MYSIWKARDRSNPLSANSEGGSQSSSSLELTFIYRKELQQNSTTSYSMQGGIYVGLNKCKNHYSPLRDPPIPPTSV